MLKFKNFLQRTGLDEKPFQTECFEWCLNKEQNKAVASEAVSSEAVTITSKTEGGLGGNPPQVSIPSMGASACGAGGGTPGGILALEMGLGKTIIMLGLIECNFQRHTLIILPRALLDQWEKNILNYFGHQPLVYHGSRKKNLKLSLLQIKQKPIVLTTYGQISLLSEKQTRHGRMTSPLHDIIWDRIICDEAHHVSHKNTNEYKGVEALRTKIKWLVTGTPIQNTEQELYSMFALLGFNKPKVYYNEDDNYMEAVKHFVFHKTKANVGIKLPALHEHIEHIQWENESERQFSSHVHSLLTTICNVPQKSIATEIYASEDPKILRMQYLTRARQVCIYPPILNKTATKQFAQLFKKHNREDNRFACSYPDMNIEELYLSESKMNAVIKTLTNRRDNQCGKIVFCHYYEEIDAIEKRLLEAGFTNIRKFDGRVKNSQREKILSEPAEVLLAQIKICREGLNLQDNYSEVYFPSPHFNPAVEDQAIARCWRIGQTKEVNVFRYVMVDTEEQEQAIAVQQALAVQQIVEQQTPLLKTYSLDSYSALLQSKKRERITRMEEACEVDACEA